MNPLDNIERLAQRFVEGTFHRFFGKKLHPVDLVDHLIAFIETERNGREDDLIPANYEITVNPTDYIALVRQNNSEEITSELVAYLATFADEATYQFDGSLRIALNQNGSVHLGQIKIGMAVEIINRGRP